MDTFIHQVLAGLATGGIYASVALALVMIYQATHLLNFAQGEMAMFSTYIAWALINAGVPYWAAFFLTVALRVRARRGDRARRDAQHPQHLGAAARDRLHRPARDLQQRRRLDLHLHDQGVPEPVPEGAAVRQKYLSSHELGAIGVTLVVLALLWAFFRFTPLGLAMRAAAQNPMSSRLVGIRVGWMLALGWGLAAAIGAIAGMMVAPIVYLDPNMMAGILLYAFAAALIGGIDSPGGAVLGGFLVGVLENVLGAYVIGNELKLAVALVLIIGVLLVKPSGLFGTVQVTRV